MTTLVGYAGLGTTELLAIVLMLTLKWIVPILVVIWVMRKLIANNRENKRLRLEVSKLAHELEQYRMRPLETGSRNQGTSF
jgi:hypothetical protein